MFEELSTEFLLNKIEKISDDILELSDEISDKLEEYEKLKIEFFDIKEELESRDSDEKE